MPFSAIRTQQENAIKNGYRQDCPKKAISGDVYKRQAHKLSTLEALLRKVISEELRSISIHIPFEPDTDSASAENESNIIDFLESF